MNRLFYGDNLHVMRQLLGNASVDLIYLDPPFKSNKNYNMMYYRRVGRPIPEQEEAFCDTWEMDAAKREVARSMPQQMREHGVDDYYVQFWRYWMKALEQTQPRLLAYLVYMVQRLMYMKLILKPTGSIYLHCDPEASHYIKVMMDAVFGHDNYQNEIVWKRHSAHSGSSKWGPIHDTVLFYSMSDKYKWNPVYQPYDEEYVQKHYANTDERGSYQHMGLTGAGIRNGDSGRPWRGVDPTAKGRHWAVPVKALQQAYPDVDLSDLTTQEKLDLLDDANLIYWPPNGNVPRHKRYLDEAPGVKIQDIVSDIPPLSAQSKRRLGFPTQKPPDLLKRIIQASSDPGDVVFDPFCGCGTTIYAAQETGRQWVGCDIAILAIRLVEDQLDVWYNLKRNADYTTAGVPNSVESATHLFKQDPFQFEHWIVERVGAFPTKKTGDKGVDGVMYYDMDGGDMGKMIFSVKGGNIRPTDIRDLAGTRVSDEDAHLAGFISIREPTKAMREAASEAGIWHYKGETYERVQLLTVREIVEDKRLFRTPARVQYRDDHLQQSFQLTPMGSPAAS